MKTKLLWAVILLLLATNVVSLCGWWKDSQKNALLEDYYLGSEELLDILENEYNWIDAIDNEHYYTAASKLHNNR